MRKKNKKPISTTEATPATRQPRARKRRFGDRPDGYKLRTIQPMCKVSPYIMPNRTGACVYFNDSFEVTEVENYIRKKRNQGLKGFGLMHVLLAAYVRVVSQRPTINRFISGQKIFTHDEDIAILLTIKREMRLDAEETIVKLHCTPWDTADDVYRKLSKLIDENRVESADSDFDDAAKALNYIPGLVLKNAMWLLKLLDYFGLLGKKLLEISPFHGSFFVTSMGSLGIPPVFHHLYDFGNIPVFFSFGAKRKATEYRADGAAVERKYIDYTIVCDERICDGFNLASAFKLMRLYLRNPHVLDDPPESVTYDVE